jgi:cell shape-determining protein MreC
LTSEIERIKILEAKISHVVDYINKILSENEKLKQQAKELRAEKKEFEEMLGKANKLDENLKKYHKEREVIKEKIETIISQIDQLGI